MMSDSKPTMRFELESDEKTGMTYIVGPEKYMKEQGHELLDRILAGEDTIFNMTCGQAPDIYQAILARLQTDYAGWAGLRQVESWLAS